MTLEQGCQTVPVSLNGEPRAIPAGLSVKRLLGWLEIDSERVAVELDREIVRQPLWDSTLVDSGAEIEIVQFVGGG